MNASRVMDRPAARATPVWSPVAVFNLVVLVGLLTALIALLWPHWVGNPDLSHGLVAPFIFFLLLHEARSGTARYLPSGPTASVAQTSLLLLGLLTLCASGLYAASLDWSHALVVFTLTVAFTFLLGGALVGFASSRIRLVPLNWSSCIAVALWPLSAPIPPGTYSRLTLGLQLTITENVLRALHLLGIPAQRHGNIIELATTSVGVEEACSGIRSLISCLFAGLFFSATLVRNPWARAFVIVLAGPIAIGMNFARSLTLTLLANSGVNISGRWHDFTGFAVLGLTAALLALLAVMLEAHAKRSAARAKPVAPPPADDRRTSAAPPLANSRMRQWPLLVSLLLALTLIGFFWANTHPSLRRSVPVPDLMAILPAESPGWQVRTSNDLYQFRSSLQTDHLAQRTYSRPTPDGIQQITVYLAYWPAGQAPVSLVASHTPDACWPGAGWVPVPDRARTGPITIAGRTLAPPESRFFQSGQYPQYVWFWHLYDGRPIAFRDPYSARELLAIAWHYGFSHNGDQLFVRISSNGPWRSLAAEPLIADLFARLGPLGL